MHKHPNCLDILLGTIGTVSMYYAFHKRIRDYILTVSKVVPYAVTFYLDSMLCIHLAGCVKLYDDCGTWIHFRYLMRMMLLWQ